MQISTLHITRITTVIITQNSFMIRISRKTLVELVTIMHEYLTLMVIY